ncbi:MAG: hypothetical protein WAN04_01415 [Candidatus Udaeobacter sp.]
MIDHKPSAVASAVGGSACPQADETGAVAIALGTTRSTINALRTAHTTARSSIDERGLLSHRSLGEGGFTLAELVLSMSVLALLVLLTTQLLNSAATIMTLGHRQMNADSAARELFDRMAIDFAQMVKRSDLDYYLKSSTTASDCTLCTRQRGNDQIAFYSTVPGWSAFTGAQQSPISIVGYRIHVSTDTFSNRMERLGEGLIWNGATSDRRGDGRPASVNFGAPLNPWANATNTPFDVIGPDVFRCEYYYLLKNGDVSSIPWYTISSVRGMQDVSAIIVDVAVLDPKSRVLLTDSDITALAEELPDYGGQVPGGLLASWRTALDANRTLPRPALSSVRLYERCFHLCPTAL